MDEPRSKTANQKSQSESDGMVSLPEVHSSVTIPAGVGFWKRLLAFAGPAYMVSVGYMDPGN